MATEIVKVTDLPKALQDAELVDTMVAAANARAARLAPCLAEGADPAPSTDMLAEAKLILIGAISRWNEAGSGGIQQETAGPFSMSITQRSTGYSLWPSEIESLQELCKDGRTSRAFAVETAPAYLNLHLPWCSINFGTTWCSCGTDIAGAPIYEGGIGMDAI